MSRHLHFGLGVTMVIIGLALGSWTYGMERNDNMPVAAVLAAVLIGPGAKPFGHRTIDGAIEWVINMQ